MDLTHLSVPNSIRESAQYVYAHADDVTINDAALETLAVLVEERLALGIDNLETAFGTTGSLEKDCNIIFFETACNFYFWAQDETKRWKIQHDGETTGGWYGLVAAFKRALADDRPMYDTRYMASLSMEEASEIFIGIHNIQIPLLERRVGNIIEAARFLNEKHNGSCYEFFMSCDFSAPRIAEAITRNLASFRDGAWYKDQWVWIQKRAQILPSDLAQLSANYPDFQIKDLNELTIFADYRLPQVLRHYGALTYSDDLANRINTRQIIPSGSPEEVEIRAATLIACDRLKELCPTLKLSDIDLGLWLLSQDNREENDMSGMKPHHLTPGYFY